MGAFAFLFLAQAQVVWELSWLESRILACSFGVLVRS